MDIPDDSGLQPLAAAVLFNDITVAKFLLEKGADIYAKIQRDGSAVNGMPPTEFLNYILQPEAEKQQQSKDRSAMQALLAEYQNKNK